MFEDKRYKYRNMPNLMSDAEIIEKQILYLAGVKFRRFYLHLPIENNPSI